MWGGSGAVWLTRQTCGTEEEEIAGFLQARNGSPVRLLRVVSEGRATAVFYERESDGELCWSVFDGVLFHTRLRHEGMDLVGDTDLHVSGSWHRGGNGKKSRCTILVYCDNRSGNLSAYRHTTMPQIARDNLEADLILDLYFFDGATLEEIAPAYRADLMQTS